MEKSVFGKTKDGQDITKYTMTNKNGMELSVIDFGGIITSIITPDKDGVMDDVVMGYDTPEPYFENPGFLGATIGRSANRIAGAKFTLDGKEYSLAVNENENNLHTDFENGFHVKLFKSSADEASNSVSMEYSSPDGENGFPGRFDLKVTFTLTDDNEVKIHYEGKTDKKTVANCTNHSYFNLGGMKKGPEKIEDEYIKINASRYTPVLPGAIPTGELAAVEGTVFDLRSFKRIGDDVDKDEEQLKLVQGYDHNFVLDDPKAGPAAVVEDRKTGRFMEVYTDLPGMQFYAGNCIPEGLKGKDGRIYGKRMGLCLESQYFPNSINEKNFEPPVLDVNEKYDTTTVYKFGVR